MEDDNNTLQQMRKGFFGKSTSNAPVVNVSLNESSIISDIADSLQANEYDSEQVTPSNGDHIEKFEEAEETTAAEDGASHMTEVDQMDSSENSTKKEESSADSINIMEECGHIDKDEISVAATDDTNDTSTKENTNSEEPPKKIDDESNLVENGSPVLDDNRSEEPNDSRDASPMEEDEQNNITAGDAQESDIVASNSSRNRLDVPDDSRDASPMEEDEHTADHVEADGSAKPDSPQISSEHDSSKNDHPSKDITDDSGSPVATASITPKSLRKRSSKVDPSKSKTSVTSSVPTRRSGRISVSKNTPLKKSQDKTPRSARKTPATVETDPATPVLVKSSRRSIKESLDVVQIAESKDNDSVKKTPAKKSLKYTKNTPSTPSTHDPYDFDTERESHPEPLKNIRMDFTSFGDVKYNKIGGGKYEHTEKTAEARVCSLSDLIPHSKERKSLAEFTPGSKNKASRTATAIKKGNADLIDSEEVVKTPVSKTPRKRRTDSPKSASSAKRVKEDIVLPELDAEHLWSVDHPADEDAPHEEGARVFALYDKIFYPAVVSVSGKDSLGRYKVIFVADKVVQSVPASGVIPLRALLAGHKCLFTVDPKDDPADATVISSPNAASAIDWKQGEFLISHSDEDSNNMVDSQCVSWEKLSLSSEEWKQYIHTKSKQTSQVMLDNISNVEDKRGRRSRICDSTSDKKVNLLSDDASEAGNIDINNPSNKSLFTGMIFILTSAQRDGHTTFRKKQMSEFIEDHAGIVVDDFVSVDSYPEKKAYLISDTHYRTYKYLSAMARGVPCVSHEWIWKCRDDGVLINHDEFILPAGVSIIDQQVYPLPKTPGALLKDKVVLLNAAAKTSDSKAPSFVEVWEPIVKLLGGTALTSLPDDGVAVDILLADRTVSNDFLEIARANNALISSSEWLIQSLIMEKLPDISSHPRFSYDATR